MADSCFRSISITPPQKKMALDLHTNWCAMTQGYRICMFRGRDLNYFNDVWQHSVLGSQDHPGAHNIHIIWCSLTQKTVTKINIVLGRDLNSLPTVNIFRLFNAPWHKEQEQIWYINGNLDRFQNIWALLLLRGWTITGTHDVHTTWYF